YRHDLAGSAAGWLRRRGVTLDEALSIFRAIIRAAGDDPKEDALRYVRDTYARCEDEAITGLPTLAELIGGRAAEWLAKQFPNTAVDARDRMHLTDSGNARRLVSRHGDNLRYCFKWGAWLVWNGKRW